MSLTDFTPSSSNPNLSETEIHTVLSNRRRQLALQIIERHRETQTDELAEWIAEIETDESPPPRDTRKSVYVSLKQTHLPLLRDLDLVEFDEGSKTVSAGTNLDDIRVYTEIVPKRGLFWSEYYLAVALLGLLLVIASNTGVPLVGTVSSQLWAGVFFLVIVGSGAYQLYTQRNRPHMDFSGDKSAEE